MTHCVLLMAGISGSLRCFDCNSVVFSCSKPHKGNFKLYIAVTVCVTLLLLAAIMVATFTLRWKYKLSIIRERYKTGLQPQIIL